MSWPMGPGPWNAAMGMPPNMNMGSYTPDQWTMLQQQNWQQWAQWQQQYAQWQNQCGDQYMGQMQTMQSISGVPPPPPSNASQPAPPPPDKPPPPPPPHENNQPLYGNTSTKPTPVPPPQYDTGPDNSNKPAAILPKTPNASNIVNNQDIPSVNADALKKLAEEERLFDIQFQKWEEEIGKWRKENSNHPDKQAYREYEQKFEACRAQLLERRQQMKQKKASLLATSNTNNTKFQGNPPPPPPPQSAKPSQNPSQSKTQEYQFQNQTSTQYQEHTQNTKHYSSQYDNRKQPNTSHSHYNKNKDWESQNKIQSSDTRFDSSTKAIGNTNFLPSSSSIGGIPGLDLVPQSGKNMGESSQVDLTNDDQDETNTKQIPQKAPDYSTISKGINNILGDEKIMNILSMVRVPNTPNTLAVTGNNQLVNQPYNNAHSTSGNDYKQTNQSQNYEESNYNQEYENMHEYYENEQGYADDTYYDDNAQYADNQQYDHQEYGNNDQYDNNQQQYGKDQQYENAQLPKNNQQYGNKQQFGNNAQYENNQQHKNNQQNRNNLSNNTKFGNNQQYGNNQSFGNNQQFENNPQNQNDHQQYGINRQQQLSKNTGLLPQNEQMNNRFPLLRQPQPLQPQKQYNKNPPLDNICNSGPRPNLNGPSTHGVSYSRPSLPLQRPPVQAPRQALLPLLNPGAPLARLPFQDASARENMGDNYQQPREITQVPKWEKEPMFMPSIVVDYEHKSLRLKAREFIEPVHTFDYNHISKDEDVKNANFEKEVDELFAKRPTNTRGIDNFYERDQKRSAKEPTFDDYRVRPRDENDRRRYEDRARDDRDKHARRDDFTRREDFTRRDDFARRDGFTRRDDFSKREDLSRRDEFSRRDDFARRDDLSRRDEFSRRDDFARRDDHIRRDEFTRRDGFPRSDDIARRTENRRDENYRDRDRGRERSRERRRDDYRHRSKSRDREPRKRAHSKESQVSTSSIKKPKDDFDNNPPKTHHIVMIDDLLESPGREMRPDKLVIILRGPPGSGKSYLAKQIRDKEAEHGGTARVMSIDDYFMQEGEAEERDPATGKTVKKPTLKYEYDKNFEETYTNSLKRAFKRTLTDGYFSFLIYDAVNETLKSYSEIWNFARQNGFQVYVCTMEVDPKSCYKRNIHNRTLEDIEIICARFFPTPSHHIQLDPTTLLQSAAITDVHMEDVQDDVIADDTQENEVENVFTSKWEKMDDAAQLAKLDGTSKPLRPSQLSMEDYLQLDDWTPSKQKPGKKTVRWADIEERRQQEKMRAIGFVVGQTDWNRMTDPTMGSSALTQTKYIERVRRN